MTQARIITGAAFLLLLVFAAANLGGIEILWGLNFLKFYDKVLCLIAIFTCALFFLPNIRKVTATQFDFLQVKLALSNFNRFVAFAASGIILFLIFFTFSSSNTLLGDGSLRANQIAATGWWLPTEPLDFLLHAFVYRTIYEPMGAEPEFSYRWISSLSGILFLYGSYKLATYLNPKKWLLNLLFIFSSGIVVLFFGYVESYSIAAALMPLLFLMGFKAVDGTGSKASFLILFLISALFHLVIALIFSFALVFVFLISGSHFTTQPKRVSKLLIFLVIASIVVAYVMRILGLWNLDRFLLGFWPTAENPQGILTTGHWLNVLNWLLLAALPALVMIPAIFRRNGEEKATSPDKMSFAIWSSVPAILFMLIFTPQLGGPRDWDLFSLPAFTVLLSVLSVYHFKSTDGLPTQILPAIMVSLWVTAGFVGVNSSIEKSIIRQEEIIETSRFKNLYNEYADLFAHAELEENLQYRRYDLALKAWQEPPYAREDSVYILNHLARLALERNDSASSFQFLQLATTIDTLNVYGHLLLLNYYNQFEPLDRVLQASRVIAARFPENLQALCALGLVYCQLDSLESAESVYAKANQLDSTRLDANLNYGAVLYQLHKAEQGLKYLRRADQISPNSFLVKYNLSSAHLEAGHHDSAQHYFEQAYSLAKSYNELGLASELQAKISNETDSTGDL